MGNFYQHILRRVVLIGPECTGKTWLTSNLSCHYNVPFSPEFARIFVDEQKRLVEYPDVAVIGAGQIAIEDHVIAHARDGGAKLVLHDTDLISTMVYSHHCHGNCPAEISLAARKRVADLYLLHDIDVPWEADGFQRIRPECRNELFALFKATLVEFGVNMVLISGSWNERYARAIETIDRLLA